MKSTAKQLREAGEVLSLAVITALDAQDRRIVDLEGKLMFALSRIHELERRLGLTSRNSSLPPSQDPPSAARQAKPSGKKKRTKGGQPGHKAHHRSRGPPERVHHKVEHWPAACAHCQTPLPEGLGEVGLPERRQVLELPPIRVEVTEHRLHRLRCPHCRRITSAPAPSGVGPGTTFGPRLVALSATLTVRLRASRRNLSATLSDLLDVPAPCAAELQALLGEVSRSLLPAYREVRRALRSSRAAHVDETGWSCKGQRYWLWAGATKGLSFFRLAPRRNRAALIRLISRRYPGILISDRYGVYHARAPEERQLCWAHLVRDFRAWQARGPIGETLGAWAEAEAGRLFHLWHLHRGAEISCAELCRRIRPLQSRFTRLLYRATGCGERPIERTAIELLVCWPALWSFVRHEGVEPANNKAERSLRSGVIWRKTSFGSQSGRGMRLVERLLTLAETCRKQKKNLLDYLADALTAARTGSPAPALLPTL
jgi:transposase